MRAWLVHTVARRPLEGPGRADAGAVARAIETLQPLAEAPGRGRAGPGGGLGGERQRAALAMHVGYLYAAGGWEALSGRRARAGRLSLRA
jgi:hypothetical protein